MTRLLLCTATILALSFSAGVVQAETCIQKWEKSQAEVAPGSWFGNLFPYLDYIAECTWFGSIPEGQGGHHGQLLKRLAEESMPLTDRLNVR
jgi:hypothetical protein